MIFEVCFRGQAVTIILYRTTGIPGAVRIIIEIANTDKIPGMVTGRGIACYNAVVNTTLQQHPVKQRCITGTDAGSVEHGRVCRIHHIIAFIPQMHMVIGDIFTDPIVGHTELLIIGHIRFNIFCNEVLDCCRQLCFLGCGGSISKPKAQYIVVITVLVRIVTTV